MNGFRLKNRFLMMKLLPAIMIAMMIALLMSKPNKAEAQLNNIHEGFLAPCFQGGQYVGEMLLCISGNDYCYMIGCVPQPDNPFDPEGGPLPTNGN